MLYVQQPYNMLFMLCCRNHTHFHEQITIRKQFQHLVCPRNHSQVIMRERPMRKVHIPTTILLLVELDTILPFPAQHAPHHHRCPATYFLYCVHIDCKGTKLFHNGRIIFRRKVCGIFFVLFIEQTNLLFYLGKSRI